MPQRNIILATKGSQYQQLMPLAQALRYIQVNAGERTKMLRITENTENGKTVRLRLDGTVNSASYTELEAACSRHQDAPGKIILVDMAGVVFMNNEVASKLAGLRSEQLRIINCSPFIETLLGTVERELKNQH